MFKRLLFIGLLSISLIALVSTEAPAGSCTLYRGFLLCPPKQSVCAEALLRGVGAQDINTAQVCVSLAPQDVVLFCLNHGGNSEPGEGIPFSPNALSLTGSEVIQAGEVTKKGNAVKEICFHDPEIYAAISVSPNFPDPADTCQNGNWGFDQNNVPVITTYAYYSAWAPDQNGDLYLTSQLCQFCEFDTTAAECRYNCSEVPSTDPNYSICSALAGACETSVLQ